MRLTLTALITLALACETFAYWGLNAAAGRQIFDEMAGMVPLAAAVLGVVFAACAALVWWRGPRKNRR